VILDCAKQLSQIQWNDRSKYSTQYYVKKFKFKDGHQSRKVVREYIKALQWIQVGSTTISPTQIPFCCFVHLVVLLFGPSLIFMVLPVSLRPIGIALQTNHRV